MPVGLSRTGAYLPYHRIERSTIAEAWEKPPLPGSRTVANVDEDSLTMGVEAALDCLEGRSGGSPDGVFFASTTPPYLEKQNASLIASVLDLGEDTRTRDFTGSIRSGTIALTAAFESVESGACERVLVVAADCRTAKPRSDLEPVVGDAAAAILVEADPDLLTLEGRRTLSREFLGTWRRSEDLYLQVYEPKLERTYGYLEPLEENLGALLEETGVAAGELDHTILSWPDARSHRKAAGRLGVPEESLQRSLFEPVGHTGAAHPLLMLADAAPALQPGESLLLGSYGDGSDGFVFRVGEAPNGDRAINPVEELLENSAPLDSYTLMLDHKDLLRKEEPEDPSSEVAYWRDQDAEHPLHGVRCTACGTVQYPPQRVCFECGEFDEFEQRVLQKHGTVYTFTLDHIQRRGGKGRYLAEPIPRLVIDLDGGGRIFLEMTDSDPDRVELGMDVELTLRRIHQGAGFNNYYWKAREPRMEPIRGAANG